MNSDLAICVAQTIKINIGHLKRQSKLYVWFIFPYNPSLIIRQTKCPRMGEKGYLNPGWYEHRQFSSTNRIKVVTQGKIVDVT